MAFTFSVLFDIAAQTVTLTDTTSGRTADIRGLFKITHQPSGTILYQHPSWDDAPSAWASYDVDGSFPLYAPAAISLATDTAGEYLTEYKAYDASVAPASATLTQRTYDFQYTSPTVVIDLSVACSTSELTSTDSTDYNVVIGGVSYTPTTLTRSHTIVKPAGSGYSGTLGTTSAASRTIGGGSTAGTRLWTRTWQTTISTVLAYTLSEWSTTAPTVYVSDTVDGGDEIFAQCDATICALAQCWYNLLARWRAALTTNLAWRDSNRDKVLECAGLWDQLFLQERCGEDTQATVLAIKDLLKGENCTCATQSDTASVPIVPWAAALGGGSTASTFQFRFGNGVPSSGIGADDDLYLDKLTDDLYKKLGGAWTFQVNIGGDDGATGPAGSSSTSANVLYNDLTTDGTSTATIETVLKTWDIPANTFVNNGDCITLRALFTLAANDNDKTCKLYFANTVVAQYFTDELIAADATKQVELIAEVNRITLNTQRVSGWAVSGGYTYIPLITEPTENLAAAVTVKTTGFAPSGGTDDVTCKQLFIEVGTRMSGNVVGASAFEQGIETLEAGVTLPVNFDVPFVSDGYTLTYTAYDVDSQPVPITISDKTVNGFSVVSNTASTFEWSCILA